MELPFLSVGQYQLVYNALSFGIAAMGAGLIFFLAARSQVGAKYRPALLISAVVVAIAAYHYLRMFDSWSAAFVMSDGGYAPSGEPFNDAYRYIDWLLTVPLLLVEAVAVLALSRPKAGSMIARLSIAAVLMIALGYPGEVTDDGTMRFVWGFLSSVPFVYILWVLWGELGTALERQPPKVRVLMRNLRLLLLGTWGVYPIAYMAPFFGFEGASAIVAIQLGYTVADVLAKPGFGLLIYAIAREKTIADGDDPIESGGAAAA